MALSTPSLMSRMQMLPAEKMLASVDPGYPYLSVTSLLDTHLNNGSLQFVGYTADTPAGVVYGEALNNAFYDAAAGEGISQEIPACEVGRIKPLLQSLLKAIASSAERSRRISEFSNSSKPFSPARDERVCSVDGELPAGEAIGPR